ncbi:carbamoyltransferase [Streptomyces sp. NPDC020983]|uniref:carbamoyltransferase n=1 Tax=Streptomyces sp. NPDC020983 TaxID=3365106 RepID=UPI00379B21F3
MAVVQDGEIVFAAHSERYSRSKNDPLLNNALIDDALGYADDVTEIVHFEHPWLKLSRRLRAGQLPALRETGVRRHLDSFAPLRGIPVRYVSHHRSHASGAYFCSPFRDAALVVVDAIGEWETLTVWHARGTTLRKVHSVRYPHSVGLLYSAMTQRVGLKPNEEEYILMGMAAYGEPKYKDLINRELVAPARPPDFRLRRNLHRGLTGWHPEITEPEHLASSVQAVTEEFLEGLFRWVAAHVPSRNLVYSGGVALNCLFNGKLASLGLFDDIWIPPNPGDAGSAVGAALARTGEFVPWPGPYLGHDIRRHVDATAVAQALAAGHVVGLANGRAEYGPRALGNRSLLADPRSPGVKDRVNEIKRRQKFRPFAPVVLADRAHHYFETYLPETPYMQYVLRCRAPEDFPGVCHVDGTSRVQTVRPTDGSVIARVIQEFDRLTGCPVLLNTSLNVKGEPLVNTWPDALRFQHAYGVPLF